MKSHHEPYWDLVKRIITESDIVLEVLDARLVELSRNEEVENLIEEVGRPVIFVINKSDLVSKDSLKKSVAKLRERGVVVFLSTKEKGSWRMLFSKIKQVFAKHGKREVVERGRFDPKPKYREVKGEIVVGVLGYPNVGKSSIINQLAHKKKVQVSKKAGTTHGIHWIKATDEIKLIDSPGVIPLKKQDELRYALIGARNPERLKEPEVAAEAVIDLFLRLGKKAFEKFYKIDIGGLENYEVIEELARKKSHLKKGGVEDIDRTSRMIVRNWQQGKLKL